MAQTYTENGGGAPDGSKTTFTYSFETIEETNTTSQTNSEVKVALNGVTQNTNKYYVQKSTSSIQFHNTNGVDSTVQAADGAPLSGVKVRVYRDTKVSSPTNKRHVFQAGSAIKAQALNDLYEHALFALDEEREQNIFNEDIEDGAVTSAKIQDLTIVAGDIANTTITGAKLANDTITATQIAADAVGASELADNSVASANIIDGTIVNADINANLGLELTKLEDVASSKIIVGNGSNKATQVSMSGDVTINSAGVTAIGSDAVQIANISDKQISSAFNASSDDKLPTSKAVADYVQTKIDPIGGLEVIDDDESFPNTLPATGVIISIKDAGGLIINGSGVSTNGDTLDNTTVTINNFPSDLQSTTLAAGVGLMVQSTGSSQTYNYHKALLKEADLVNLSSDINDFGNRYRVASSAPSSNNDEGDLYFDTTSNKMYVHDGSAWGQVTSTGEFKILGIKDNGQAHDGSGPTFNGSNDQYDLFEGTSDASITQASQLIVVLNGVVQKPNDGTWNGSNEGFHLDGSDGIRFCDPPVSGSTLFITKCGSAVSVNTPADNSVTAGKLDLTLGTGKIIYGTGTDAWATLNAGSAGQVLKMNSGATAPEWGSAAVADDSVTSAKIVDGTIVTADIADDAITEAKLATLGDVKWGDNSSVILGAGSDGILFSDGNNGFYRTGGTAGTFTIQSGAGTPETIAKFIGDGAVELYHNDSKKFETTSAGANITGGITTDGASTFNEDVTFTTGTTNINLVWDKSDSALEFADGVKATFGTGADLEIYHSGSHSYIANTTGDLIIQDTKVALVGKTDGDNMLVATEDGAVDLYYNNTQEFATKSGGVKLFGHSESYTYALTSAASVTIDFSLANHFTCTMGHNITFANPSTESVGQSGTITLTQDGSGSRIGSWGTQFLWAGGTPPTLSTAVNAVDRIDYVVVAADKIHCVASLDMKASS